MPEVETTTCPTCNADWEVEVIETKRVYQLHSHGSETQATDERRVVCPNGHSFEYTQGFMGDPLRHVVKVPGKPITGHMPTVQGAGEPCKGCGGPIQPRQLYLVADGPRHVWCGR